jgi:hypothetical protein
MRGGKLFELYVDFKNAFGSPDHNLIFAIMRWFNIPEYIIVLMEGAYAGFKIKIRVGRDGLTPEFVVEKGIVPHSATLSIYSRGSQ